MQGNDSRPFLSSERSFDYLKGEQPLHAYLAEYAATKPKHTAYIFYGAEITWAQLARYTARTAAYLIQSGVRKGNRVALFMQNCPQYIIAHYAVQSIGCIVVPLNPMYREEEIAYGLQELEVSVLFAGDELYNRAAAVRERLPYLHTIVSVHYADMLPQAPTLPLPLELQQPKRACPGVQDMKDVLHREGDTPAAMDVDIWHDASLAVFTSGTTGRPKGAMLTYGNALFKTAASFHANEMDETGILLAVAPLCHIAGMVFGVNIPAYSSMPTILLTRFDPETAVSAIEQYRVTDWYSVAPMNLAILGLPGIKERNLTSLKNNLATSFGVPVTEKLAEDWRALTGGCRLYEAAYGLSETHTCDTYMPADAVKFGSCGVPTYDTDIRIVDPESGDLLAPGEKGEILVKNPGVFKGYWRRPDATAETLKDGYVCTGDIGYLDEDGYLYFIGRAKEMMKCSGYSVFPEDVEALLLHHPAIRQAAVIGIPDEVRGESVKAVVVLDEAYKDRVTAEEIMAWSKENMAAYKCPRVVEFRDQLPATSSGKVLRRLLKELQ